MGMFFYSKAVWLKHDLPTHLKCGGSTPLWTKSGALPSPVRDANTAQSRHQGDKLRPNRSVKSLDTTERCRATALQIGYRTKFSQFGVRRRDAALDEARGTAVPKRPC